MPGVPPSFPLGMNAVSDSAGEQSLPVMVERGGSGQVQLTDSRYATTLPTPVSFRSA